jgi:[lysine-biosynthesis-protein LysW]--L-2-aminoadipate ligase
VINGRGIAIVGNSANPTNNGLVRDWTARGLACEIVPTGEARVAGYEAVLGRLDVRPTLDGVEPGLLELLLLERGGTLVLNKASALLTTHDKLRTAAALRRAGLPHPATWHLPPCARARRPSAPVVLKPRFGSWGRDVCLCRRDAEVAEVLRRLETLPWFARHGVLVQEVVASPGFDLRLVVAGGRVVGAVERHPRQDEWRTNVSAGASRFPTTPGKQARAIAVSAARAVEADLVGVDLMPQPGGDFVVIEVNGAVDFDPSYSHERDVYGEVAAALGLIPDAARVPTGAIPDRGQ